MPAVPDLRPSPIAGTWYPGNPERLAQSVDAYLAPVTLPPLNGEVVALIAPHAGHIYSGLTAAHAFSAVKGQSRSPVAVVSPFHSYHNAPLLTTAHRAYQTPLGPVWVDSDALLRFEHALAQKARRNLTAIAYDEEHSLEIELPFLQRTLLGPFKLLPLMVRSREPRLLRAAGEALAEALADQPALLVASTDLSHFYPERLANELDAEMLRQVAAFSPEGVLETELQEKGFACGVGAVALVLWAGRALGATHVELLHHSTSGDATGDHHSVVGYGAAVVLK